MTGAVEPNMAVTNMSVSPDGTTITLTLTVANIAISKYTAVVCTANSCSLTTNVGPNAIEVF